MRVWDPRAPDAPAAAFLPAAGGPAPDAWCVAVGNAHTADERCVLAGYANGDLKMFDLRGGGAAVRWEANVGKGVCGVQVGWAGRQCGGVVACGPHRASWVPNLSCGQAGTEHAALPCDVRLPLASIRHAAATCCPHRPAALPLPCSPPV